MLFMDINGSYSCKMTLLNTFVPLNEILHVIHGQHKLLVASCLYVNKNWSIFIPCRCGYSEMFHLYPKLFYCTKGVTHGALEVFELVASLFFLFHWTLFHWQVISRSKDWPLTYFVSLALFSAGQKAVNAPYIDRELNLSIKHRHD